MVWDREHEAFSIPLFSLDEMHVFHIGKRSPPYQHWEPIYIGTHEDPLYDERLSWEGRSDKMTQVAIYAEKQTTIPTILKIARNFCRLFASCRQQGC